nr:MULTISPECIES: glutamine amidotransferase [unclassified Oceanispirochaeta]
MKKILIAGESWMSYTTHVKGFDSFTTSTYEEGVDALRNAFLKGNYEVDFIPNHLAPTQFPMTLEEMIPFSCIVLSDIGSNTLLLSDTVFPKANGRATGWNLSGSM